MSFAELTGKHRFRRLQVPLYNETDETRKVYSFQEREMKYVY